MRNSLSLRLRKRTCPGIIGGGSNINQSGPITTAGLVWACERPSVGRRTAGRGYRKAIQVKLRESARRHVRPLSGFAVERPIENFQHSLLQTIAISRSENAGRIPPPFSFSLPFQYCGSEKSGRNLLLATRRMATVQSGCLRGSWEGSLCVVGPTEP